MRLIQMEKRPKINKTKANTFADQINTFKEKEVHSNQDASVVKKKLVGKKV